MSLKDTAVGMADELTGAVVIGALTTGTSPSERLDRLTKQHDGSWEPEFVEAATDEYRRRNPEDVDSSPEQIAEAVYAATKDNIDGPF
jgi:6-phosphogluconolactonase/glucosamine-6-phosphate isomerase/deaminase